MRLLPTLLCAAALTLSAPAETFSVGKGAFLLNGEPFVVKAAEVHYPRIPEPYWEHRIRMCKALGMNTLCLYVFWNFHEREPGVFDFSGNADVAKFCRLAQKHGLYVIVRPGPYVCAEWEMGGLPWWLLQKEDIRLRSNDPHYLACVGRFLKRLGQELAPLQLARGGNIIMVQVENEYGAYATDKAHVANIRDLVRAAGFTDVPLFQCDWSSTFQRNGLDDLLWTINFGTGADIEAQFRPLKAARPDSAFAGFDLRLGNVNIGNLVDFIPSLDSIVPMLRSFQGTVDFNVAAASGLDSCFNLQIPTLRSAIHLRGDSLVLMDGETFAEISKKFLFKNKERNLIDSIAVNISVQDGNVTVYPFIIQMDRYKAAVGGTQDLDMNFDYHISILKSPVPFKLGLNIRGNLDKMKFGLGRAKYKNAVTPVEIRKVDSTIVNMGQQIVTDFRKVLQRR